MPFEIKPLDHVGLDALQVVVSCRHGETVRVFTPNRATFPKRDIDLLRETAREHAETFGCTCAQRSIRVLKPSRHNTTSR